MVHTSAHELTFVALRLATGITFDKTYPLQMQFVRTCRCSFHESHLHSTAPIANGMQGWEESTAACSEGIMPTTG